jgi:hypothetical protein
MISRLPKGVAAEPHAFDLLFPGEPEGFRFRRHAVIFRCEPESRVGVEVTADSFARKF